MQVGDKNLHGLNRNAAGVIEIPSTAYVMVDQNGPDTVLTIPLSGEIFSQSYLATLTLWYIQLSFMRDIDVCLMPSCICKRYQMLH